MNLRAALTQSMKHALGIEETDTPRVVDERSWGRLTTRTQASAERHDGQSYVRLSFRTFQGSGRAGSSTKVFAWPVADPDSPIELARVMERIVDSASPAAPRRDPRSGLGRWFDRLCGLDLLNHHACLSEHRHFGRRTWLEARVYRTRDGVEVTLIHRVEGRSSIWVRLPLGTIEALQEWAGRNAAFSEADADASDSPH